MVLLFEISVGVFDMGVLFKITTFNILIAFYDQGDYF